MPIVAISWLKGRTHEKKASLAVEITKVFERIERSLPEDVVVLFNDVSEEDWYIAGRSAQKPKGNTGE